MPEYMILHIIDILVALLLILPVHVEEVKLCPGLMSYVAVLNFPHYCWRYGMYRFLDIYATDNTDFQV